MVRMPLPISDKEDEWFAVSSLISDCFTSLGDVTLFPHQHWHVRTSGDLASSGRVAACKSGLCDLVGKSGLPKECVGSPSQGALNS